MEWKGFGFKVLSYILQFTKGSWKLRPAEEIVSHFQRLSDVCTQKEEKMHILFSNAVFPSVIFQADHSDHNTEVTLPYTGGKVIYSPFHVFTTY